MNRWNVISRLGLFLFIGMTLSSELVHSAAKLTLHGKILKPDNTPVNSSSVSFQIQIRSPGVENCLLYQETQTLNLSSNPGIFNLSIGSGTRPASTVDGGFTLSQIFQNRSVIDLSAAAGACTNPATSYTPAADDQRNISIQFNDGSGWQSVTAQKINPVPRALDSGQVGGYDSAQLLRVADGVPTAQTELSGAQWTELLAVISGTSTVYSKPNQLNGVNLPALSNGQTMVWNAGAWTAVTPQALPGGGTNGQVLTSDGAGSATWTNASGSTDASSLTSGTLGDARLSSNVALKNASNTFSMGNQNITNGASTEVNLILKGAAAQSANMLEVRNSANTLLYSVETSGTPVANTDLANKAYVDSANSTSSANAVRKDGTIALTGDWGVGNFDITGIKNIGTSGYFNQGGMAAPALSAAGEGRIYFDSVAGKFKVSQNGGAYADLVGAGGGSGDVVGPASATDNAIARFDSTTGKLIQNSVVRVDDSGNFTGVGVITAPTNLAFNAGTSYIFDIPDGTTKAFSFSNTSGGWNAARIDVTKIAGSNSDGNMVLQAGTNPNQLYLSGTGATSGNVGIGTATPGARLEVAGQVKITGGSPGAGKVLTSDAVGLATWAAPAASNYIGTADGTVYSSSSAAIVTPIGPELMIQNTSNTIGSGSFLKLLAVNGGINQYSYIGAISSSSGSGYAPNIVFGQRTGGSAYNEAMRISSSGNVGIGTTTPASPLDVTAAFTQTSGILNAQSITMTHAPSANSTVTANALDISATLQGANDSSNIRGLNVNGQNSNSNYISNIIGISTQGLNTGGGATSLNGIYSSATNNSATGMVMDSYGVFGDAGNSIGSTTSSMHGGRLLVTNSGSATSAYGLRTGIANTGTLTNAYGVYVENIQATNKYSIYTSDSTAPISLAGALDQRGMAAPAVSPAAQGRIYFDSTANKFKVSENGAAFSDLITTGALSGSGTVNAIPRYTASTTFADSGLSDDGTTITASRTLRVNAPLLGKAATTNATTTIDFGSGNLQSTTQDCTLFALHNLKDGGSYMFAVQGTNVATCSFNAFSDAGTTPLTVHMPPDHGATTSGKHTVYNFAVVGGHVYVAWTPGY